MKVLLKYIFLIILSHISFLLSAQYLTPGNSCQEALEEINDFGSFRIKIPKSYTLSPETEACNGVAAGRDAWMLFQPAQDLNFDFIFRTLLRDDVLPEVVSMELYSGACDNLQRMACSTDNTDLLEGVHHMKASLSAGQTYYIRLVAESGANEQDSDTFGVLSIDTPWLYDTCEDIDQLIDSGIYIRNFAIDNTFNMDGNIPECAAAMPQESKADAWFRYNNGAGDKLLVNLVLDGSGVAFLEVYEGELCPEALDAPLICRQVDDPIILNVAPEQTYHFRIIHLSEPLNETPLVGRVNIRSAINNINDCFDAISMEENFTYEWSIYLDNDNSLGQEPDPTCIDGNLKDVWATLSGLQDGSMISIDLDFEDIFLLEENPEIAVQVFALGQGQSCDAISADHLIKCSASNSFQISNLRRLVFKDEYAKYYIRIVAKDINELDGTVRFHRKGSEFDLTICDYAFEMNVINDQAILNAQEFADNVLKITAIDLSDIYFFEAALGVNGQCEGDFGVAPVDLWYKFTAISEHTSCYLGDELEGTFDYLIHPSIEVYQAQPCQENADLIYCGSYDTFYSADIFYMPTIPGQEYYVHFVAGYHIEDEEAINNAAVLSFAVFNGILNLNELQCQKAERIGNANNGIETQYWMVGLGVTNIPLSECLQVNDGGSSRDSWIVFSGSGDGFGFEVSFTSELEVSMEVYSGTCDNLNLISCTNRVEGENITTIKFTDNAIQDYYIRLLSKSELDSFIGDLSIHKTLNVQPLNLIDVFLNSDRFIEVVWESPEGDFDGFELERSESGWNDFQNLADLAPASTRWLDENIAAGFAYYYRVRAYVLSDNQKIYTPYSNIMGSSIAELVSGAGDFLEQNTLIYPNPFDHSLSLTLPVDLEGKIIIKDLLGNQLMDRAIRKGNREYHFDLKFLSRGMYIIELQYPSYAPNMYRKVIKN